MKLAVIGSRSFTDYEVVRKVLDKLLHKIEIIVTGDAIGADSHGVTWAKANKKPFQVFEADWKQHGNNAGFVRNYDIIENANVVIAFWDGKSSGTKHSIKLARAQKKEAIIINKYGRLMK